MNLRPPRPERGALPDCATLRLRSARAPVAAYSEAPTAQQGRQTAPKTRSLTFAGGHRKRPRRSGAVAQLGERCNRTAEVVSSNLISSTTHSCDPRKTFAEAARPRISRAFCRLAAVSGRPLLASASSLGRVLALSLRRPEKISKSRRRPAPLIDRIGAIRFGGRSLGGDADLRSPRCPKRSALGSCYTRIARAGAPGCAIAEFRGKRGPADRATRARAIDRSSRQAGPGNAIDRSREAKGHRRRLLPVWDRGRRASDVCEPSFLSCRDVLRSPQSLLGEPAGAPRTSAERFLWPAGASIAPHCARA